MCSLPIRMVLVSWRSPRLVREPDDAPEASLSEIAQAESPEVSSWATATFGEFSGVTGEFTEEGTVLQEWYLEPWCGAAVLHLCL